MIMVLVVLVSYSQMGCSEKFLSFISDAPFDTIARAQKLCRYAASALEHEDISTAIQNCEEVLELLRPYNNN